MTKKQIKKQNKKSGIASTVLFIICICVFAFSLYKVLSLLTESHEDKQNFENLVEIIEKEEPGNPEETKQDRFEKLYEMNNDFYGWISIPDTRVNYPFMNTPNDPEFYLRKNFDKEYSNAGVPFVGEGCTLDSDNLIIYGHNMKNGTMFADIMNYDDQKYYEEHKTMYIDSLTESRTYEVIAAFHDKVHTQDEVVFKYYNYTGDLTEVAFDEYVDNVKKKSYFKSDLPVEYGDQLVTLSTCSYHVQDGRFVLVAKEVSRETK